jgi:8-oxo-dGTP diphosphatase
MRETVAESLTGSERACAVRRVYLHDSAAPTAVVVTPSVFVAARDGWAVCYWFVSRTAALGSCRVDGSTSVRALWKRRCARRPRSPASRCASPGWSGCSPTPAHVVVSAAGDEVRQQFVECLHAWAVGGTPVPDVHETIDAAWFDPADVAGLVVERGAYRRITWALSGVLEPHLD